jgi:ribosomal protein L11 methyltransferase
VPIPNLEHPGWLEIYIDIDPVAHEAMSTFLFDLGCTGIVTEDFQGHSLKAYLPFKKNPEYIRKRISTFLQKLDTIFPEIPSPELTFTEIENQDWNRNWRRFFHADRVTRNLLIVPAWEPIPDGIDGHVLRIDPGPAFGTGQHATTRMCLEAMEKIQSPKPWTLLDVGTGSGILATYGAKLGASRILAIDIDPEALRWAQRNIQINDLTEFIELSDMPLKQVKDTFSVLTANLILGQILKLFHHFSHLLKPGGWLILSGILKDQVEEAKRALDKTPFNEIEILYQEDWGCMIAKKA